MIKVGGCSLKRSTKIILLVIAFIVVIGVLLRGNGIHGDPISKYIAKNTANKYLDEHYHDKDFEVEDVFYNFKDGYYHARIVSPTSIDSHFELSISGDQVVIDNYENSVLSGWNTWERIDNVYREMVDEVFSAPDFPLESGIDFGTIEIYEEYASDDPFAPEYGVTLSELELDKAYDIKQLAKTKGHIIYYAQDEDITYERASELLLILKDKLDEVDIPFYAVDFILEKPRDDDGVQSDDLSIHTLHFLYDDIYEKDLAERIEAAHEMLMKLYEEEDRQLQDLNK